MGAKIKTGRFVINLFVVFILFALCGCAQNLDALPENMPLSEFMIGEWKVVSRVNSESGEALEVVFPKVSIDSDVISYGETYQAEYHFVEDDTIFVDNKRLASGETWRLERDGERLIVYQEYQGFKTTIKLERSKR